MQSNSIMKAVLAIALCVSLVATGCTAQWISVALADLPVLTQMALNIASLVSTLQAGKQLNGADAVAISNISAEATKDLSLLQALYNEYKSSPSTGTIENMQNVIAEISQNLPALLAAAHISDAVLSARITAAVNLILTTVQSFAALIPQTSAAAKEPRGAGQKAIPNPKQLKQQWNRQVCAPTGNSALDAVLEGCVIE